MLGMTGIQTAWVLLALILAVMFTITSIVGEWRRVQVAKYTGTADPDRGKAGNRDS